MTTTTLTAPDIVCDGCANAIQRALGKLPGVSNVAVDVDHKTVAVTHEDATTSRTTLVDALDRAGFPVAGDVTTAGATPQNE